MKKEHQNGRGNVPEEFEARMIAKRDREGREAAEKKQREVPVNLLDINGVKVAFGELPQLAHQIQAKRACKLVIYFSDEARDTARNWRHIFLQTAQSGTYPDCLYFVFHLGMAPGHDPKMEERLHKEDPSITNLINDAVTAITEGDNQLIPVVQASKHWSKQPKVELTMLWL